MPTGVNPGDDGVGTSTAGAATVNHTGGTITTESLSTASASDYAFTLTNSVISPGSVVLISVGNGTNTTVPCYVHSVQVSNGQVTFKIRNAGGSALNGTLIIMFACL